jgi:2'-5' RNA ligase
MKSRYNIALIPVTQGEQVVELSQKFKDIADQYLLGDSSLPHVTIHQFLAEEHEVEDIWIKTCDALNQKTIDLTFKEFSCITFNNAIFWVSLLPDHCDKLAEMNRIVADAIKNPASKSKSDYDPHMTLINTKNSEYKQIAEKVEKSYTPISDRFILSLGKSDDIGQYTKLLYKCESKPSVACRR